MEALAHDANNMNKPAQAKAWLKLALLTAAAAAWCVITMRFGQGNVYTALGPYALLVGVSTCVLHRVDLVSWFAPRGRPIVLGLGIGILMTVLTYPVFQLLSALVPSFGARVALLYSGARSAAMALVCGSIWTPQRMLTRSLLSPLLAHLIWTPT